ncbi:MAG: hypothetical protein AVDCRST_MAG38-2425 [uncultured Solirubrobacteraceae bacterium]|uniref:PspA-associated domain-containing protein n=1 Tax=uncultured Solirubrobacteraceae bacterium TaxID=1162706 RepID=A0A6J4S6B5_9ACTN|nr:MAG: hypothetical protein AVDCRST_MAG38-2425 [uncultured Solirubrobacteraceae bacterium]
MIVRVATDGQYRLPDADAARLNELDNEVVKAVEGGDEAAFARLFGDMLELVRRDGERLAEDELVESDVILPPADTSFAEAADGFTGEGLIPE